MRVNADRVTIAGPHGPVLAPTSLVVKDGALEFVHGEPGPGVTAFGLALTGRMKPSTGTVTVDGEADDAKLRQITAVVDAPGVSEPDEALPLRVVAGEELALGRRPAGKRDIARWLAEHDAAGLANVRVDQLGAAVRTRLLTELAACRDGVRMLVLDTPDRHTSEVESWSALAREHAERGLAVVVLTATTPVAVLPGTPTRIGADS
ncbi:ABC transporter ATP-binding protein [Amycolatopsis sp. GM8]|uniref:ABC transporter ATP-binding protein n=1 Tax=Amycolatopsis sp. GM8 TaxID=2896530 RepID=UPI001F43385D|nr:ABC transporter ATP-binding protein [Amycolatopsis sp. GM8]